MQGSEVAEVPREPDGPGGSGHPADGPVERVPGTRTGLLRRVATLPDGRRITYYSLPTAGPDSADEARRGTDSAR
ncbi:hypothetical protein MXD61_26300 [Frankia sp. AgPm24]|uniref:hypothetical protein n=1 Tax=Frankia sp. AgPm24 TaxID=631128 RepID=UPI00200D0BD0|nr:hypothetical protein [Frankia sp. AgPm24]MCK9925344.1 hypothetical protein [Frankia sp. AgPm24]